MDCAKEIVSGLYESYDDGDVEAFTDSVWESFIERMEEEYGMNAEESRSAWKMIVDELSAIVWRHYGVRLSVE